MSLDQQDIENIAVLARLRLDKSEIPEITQRITAILSMVDQMQSVDTENVEPMANPMDDTQRLRTDQITEINQREQFQAIAPAAEKGLYLVPKVID
jgi:aspartyl-tRNA(Asn)/glutamyl-tRNA(Gln) amidotransferase subunit C